MMSRRPRTSVVLIFAVLALAPAAQGSRKILSAIEDETKKLHTLFDDEWQWTLREDPEFATRIGDP